MIPKEVIRGINEYFAQEDLLDFQINSFQKVSGGDINEAALLETNEGNYFVKWNDIRRYPQMFEKEALGLELLRKAEEIKVPKPLSHDEIKGKGFLLMEAIISVEPKDNFWYNFGNQLAELHKHSNEFFGLDHDNYIGSLGQQNTAENTWAAFFINQRLEPQLRMARDSKKASSSLSKKFNALFPKLHNLFPEEAPALLHGDLWNGNFMVGNDGEAVLIDPAVYYGHREMDLAMSKLFGGFDEEFYMAYHTNRPLENDWQERTDLCNLYPLMVHLNLFGGNYLHDVERILTKFV